MSISKLNKLIKKLETLDTFLIDESDKFIDKNKKVLAGQNVQQMKDDGQESTGNAIFYQHSRKGETGKYGAYSKPYQKYKEGLGKETRYVDLRLTGEFHRSITLIQFNPGEWRFVSEDDKAPYLIANYGIDILGIQEDRLDVFSVAMELNLQKRTDKYLNV